MSDKKIEYKDIIENNKKIDKEIENLDNYKKLLPNYEEKFNNYIVKEILESEKKIFDNICKVFIEKYSNLIKYTTDIKHVTAIRNIVEFYNNFISLNHNLKLSNEIVFLKKIEIIFCKLKNIFENKNDEDINWLRKNINYLNFLEYSGELNLIDIIDFDLTIRKNLLFKIEKIRNFSNKEKLPKNTFLLIQKIVTDLNLIKIEPGEKQKFDKDLHELNDNSNKNVTSDKVIKKVIRNGFKYDGRVIRKALVKVN